MIMKFFFYLILLIYTPVTFATANSADTPTSSTADNVQQKKVEKSIEPQFSRGQLLYENHCTTCHVSLVHIRNNRKAKSIEDIRHWITRWQQELKLKWNNQDINEVSRFINERFYKY